MNADFEKQISQQPVKPLPPSWKDGILRAAREAAESRPRPVQTTRGALRCWLRDLLWPSPVAWGGLAAVWVVMLGFGSVAQNDRAARPVASVSRQQLQMVREQQNWLRQELEFGGFVVVPSDRLVPGTGYGPRSDTPANNTTQRGANLYPRRETEYEIV